MSRLHTKLAPHILRATIDLRARRLATMRPKVDVLTRMASDLEERIPTTKLADILPVHRQARRTPFRQKLTLDLRQQLPSLLVSRFKQTAV
jgi:hypothetical protein